MKAREYRLTMLDRSRESAEKWQGTVASLLGLFSTVAIVAGPNAIADVPTPELRWGVLGSVLVAGLLSLASIVSAYLASSVAKGEWSDDFDAATLRERSFSASLRAHNLLRTARQTGVAAAVLLFASGITVAGAAIIESSKGSAVHLLIVHESGARCGQLEVADGAATVGGDPILPMTSITPVDAC
jgi:hypothetical protein